MPHRGLVDAAGGRDHRPHHLYLTDENGELEAHLLKADFQGSLTVRTYACMCKVRTEPLCPYHAADRHLHRLCLLRDGGHTPDFLFPAPRGGPWAKIETIRVFERVLTSAGVPLTRRDEMGREVRRFQGHVMRVSGTQFLASSMGLGIPLVKMPQAVRAARGQQGAISDASRQNQVLPIEGPVSPTMRPQMKLWRPARVAADPAAQPPPPREAGGADMHPDGCEVSALEVRQ